MYFSQNVNSYTDTKDWVALLSRLFVLPYTGKVTRVFLQGIFNVLNKERKKEKKKEKMKVTVTRN